MSSQVVFVALGFMFGLGGKILGADAGDILISFSIFFCTGYIGSYLSSIEKLNSPKTATPAAHGSNQIKPEEV